MSKDQLEEFVASSAEDLVRIAYKSLLNREPDPTGLAVHTKDLAETRNLTRMLTRIGRSAEHVKVINKLNEAKDSANSVPGPSASGLLYVLGLPKNEVEVFASEEQLAAIVAFIKKAWTHLGGERAHFSVLTNTEFLPENLDKSIDKFWGSGKHSASVALKILDQHGFGDSSGKVCVEYGCGVGRVTIPLAGRFARVHAYDISTEHLQHAKAHAAELKVENISFHECSGNILESLEPCDFFYSKIVFQHNPPPIIYQLTRNALCSLKPDGVAIFQIPVYRRGYQFKLDEWLAAEHRLDMQMHCLPQHHIFELIASEHCALLEVREDNFAGLPFISNTFVVRKRS